MRMLLGKHTRDREFVCVLTAMLRFPIECEQLGCRVADEAESLCDSEFMVYSFRNGMNYLLSAANAGSSGVGEMWSRQLLMVFRAIPSKSSITCSFL